MKRWHIYCDGLQDGDFAHRRCSHLHAEGLDIKCDKEHEITDDHEDWNDCPDEDELGPECSIESEIMITFREEA